MIRRFFRNLQDQVRTDRNAFIIYSILRALVLVILVRSIIARNYESALVCILSLFLFYLPAFFERTMKIEIPTVFEIMIYLFIFAAEILGELNHYYVRVQGWDTMLHTVNGFLCAAVGFSLVDLLNRKSKHIELSPLYLTVVAFCFSMTIGVLWEFIEFSMDYFFLMDTQKDFVVTQFGSVTLDPNQMGAVVQVKNITDTIINTASGQSFTIDGGYLDIGILDTMKDLMVNFVGAVAFSIIGFAYVKNRDKNDPRYRIARDLLIKTVDEEEDSQS